MPHSSGGGSSGGGSHSGNGGGGSSPLGSAHNPSRHYIPGYRCFVYYRHGSPYYLYSYENPSKISSKKTKLMSLFVLIPILFIDVLLGVEAFSKPKYIKGNENKSSLIIDNSGILGDTANLKQSLDSFKQITGIIPEIYTAKDTEWNTTYSSLENYAYNLYVKSFGENETCWLIVYSENDAKTYFQFEGMQGDDTDDVLTEKKCTNFNERLQTLLIQSEKYSVVEAFTTAFNEFNETVMEWTPRMDNVGPFAFMILITAGVTVAFLMQDKLRGYKPEDLNECKQSDVEHPKTATCEYCGGTYVLGTHTSCPHCGAAIMPEDIENSGLEK